MFRSVVGSVLRFSSKKGWLIPAFPRTRYYDIDATTEYYLCVGVFWVMWRACGVFMLCTTAAVVAHSAWHIVQTLCLTHSHCSAVQLQYVAAGVCDCVCRRPIRHHLLDKSSALQRSQIRGHRLGTKVSPSFLVHAFWGFSSRVGFSNILWLVDECCSNMILLPCVCTINTIVLLWLYY